MSNATLIESAKEIRAGYSPRHEPWDKTFPYNIAATSSESSSGHSSTDSSGRGGSGKLDKTLVTASQSHPNQEAEILPSYSPRAHI